MTTLMNHEQRDKINAELANLRGKIADMLCGMCGEKCSAPELCDTCWGWLAKDMERFAELRRTLKGEVK